VKKVEEPQEDDEEGEFEVCVMGLSFNAYDNDIRELFQQCGDILHVNLLSRPDGKSKGMAFVKFSRKSAINKALELNGFEHMDRAIKVEQARGR
jgi:RNA recognition motif-containing protein